MFNTGDLGRVEATVHPDYLDHQGLGGEPIHGTGGFATVVMTARSGYEALEVTVEDLIEEADRAAARLRWRGARPSRERTDRETLESVRVEDGKARRALGRTLFRDCPYNADSRMRHRAPEKARAFRREPAPVARSRAASFGHPRVPQCHSARGATLAASPTEPVGSAASRSVSASQLRVELRGHPDPTSKRP